MGGRASPMIVKRDPCSLRALPSSQNAPVRGRTVRKPGRGADDDRFFAIQGATSGGAARPRRTGVPRPLCGVGEPPVCCCGNSSGFSTVLAGDRLGMKLRSPHRSVPITHRHDQPVGRAGGDLEFGGQVSDHQRVVAHHHKRRGQSAKQALAGVHNRRQPPMHRFGRPLNARPHIEHKPWWPRHTQQRPVRLGDDTALMPKSSVCVGVPGPGEITTLSKRSKSTASHGESFRMTAGSVPLTAANSAYRL